MTDVEVQESMVEEYVTEALTLEEPSGEGSVPKGVRGESAIPDLLRVGEISSDYLAHIDTTIHEPVIFTDNFIRFQLDNQGFLNPYSRLCVCLTNASASDPTSTERYGLPANVGTGAIFSRITLKIGGKTITEIEDFGDFHAYKSMFIAGEINKEREAVLSGRQMAAGQTYGNASLTITDDAANDQRDIGNTAWYNGMESNREFNRNNLQWNDWALLNREGVFSVTLEELIPCLRRTALPLYMLNSDQAVQIELTLANNVDRYVRSSTPASAARTFTLDRNECRIIADYTTYDQPIMDQYAEENKNISWTFMDYQLTKMSLADPDAAHDFNRNVGGAGRIVPRVFCGVVMNRGVDPTQQLNNKYQYECSDPDGADYGHVVANIKKNDKFLYPIDRKNVALHFHGVKDTEGMIPFVTSDWYSNQGGGTTSFAMEGMNQDVELGGEFFWVGFKMVDNERVGTRGLEVHMKYKDLDDGGDPFIWKCYIEAVKVAVINNGRFDCYYA